MNWRRWLVERLDHTAGLLTLVTLLLDARWSTGVLDRRWTSRQAEQDAMFAEFTHWFGP